MQARESAQSGSWGTGRFGWRNQRRRVGVTGSGEIIERRLLFDEKTRCYSYTITELVDLVFSFDNYFSTVRVLDDVPSKTCVLRWSGSGDPLEGYTDKGVEEELLNFTKASQERWRNATEAEVQLAGVLVARRLTRVIPPSSSTSEIQTHAA